MTKIHCCLCRRRTDTNKQRARIGTAAFWPLFRIHIEKYDLDKNQFSRDEDYICLKCHSSISHYGMCDRGQNKKVGVANPLVFEATIKKDVLRSFSNTNCSEATSSTEISTGDEPNSVGFNGNVIPAVEDLISSSSSRMCIITNQQINLSERVTIEEDAVPTENDGDFVLDQLMSTTMIDLSSLIGDSGEAKQCQSQQSLTKLSNSGAMHLQGFKSSQSRCFICQSSSGRKTIPWIAIQQIWFQKLCYVPKSNRICMEHLTKSHKINEEALQKIEELKQDVYVNNHEFGVWLTEISVLPKSTPYNFEEDGIEPEKYKMFLGITKDNFDDLVQYLHGMRNTAARSIRTALAMFLMLIRINMKQEIIAFNFSTTQQVVSSTINAVSAALEEYFVPQYLGYNHITREEALEKHSIKLTSKILGQSESRLCLIADCTYNYIEKPSDFELQRKTFSLHKKRNLLKPLYIVFPSGYILEAAGPYYCDANNNDAVNIRHHYKNSDLLLFLEEDDFFIFDRGFRDVVKETNQNGHKVHMPALLSGKRTHFTCEEANESRKVTMNRWVVEAVNARIKNVFPFFKHTIEGSYTPKIMRFNRIACAIMNCYFAPLFTNKDFHDVILEEFSKVISDTNSLKEEIEGLGIVRMTTRWEKATEESVPDFPKLSMDDLKRLTLGIYQIEIAKKYIEQHMKGDNHFGIFIHRQSKDIIRAKIQSRFSRSKTHNAWVKYDGTDVGYNAIKGLYCSCKVGEQNFKLLYL